MKNYPRKFLVAVTTEGNRFNYLVTFEVDENEKRTYTGKDGYDTEKQAWKAGRRFVREQKGLKND
jgi:hypothetical protein